MGLPEETEYDELTWFEVDFEEKFMLQDLSGKSIASLVERLENDPEMAREYEFNRMGVNVKDDVQLADGLEAY